MCNLQIQFGPLDVNKKPAETYPAFAEIMDNLLKVYKTRKLGSVDVVKHNLFTN